MKDWQTLSHVKWDCKYHIVFVTKQVQTMEYIHTNYGEIELDAELAQAVQEALERVLYRRIGERPPVDTLVVELADAQRDELDQIVALTGVGEDSLGQTVFDWGLEPVAAVVRMISR